MRSPGLASRLVVAGYSLYLLLPLYWLLAMALKSNRDIVSRLEWIPSSPTLANFAEIFSNPVWLDGFVNSLAYVAINTALSVAVALPAAYAFSRYRFLGDKHLFFWLLTNRMSPPAVFLLPFFQLYSALGLFDTPWAVALAHCLFTVPLAVWILEGFMSGIPRDIDDMARVDGHSLPSFFFRIFLPALRGGIGVTVFFCFMFSWVELLLARTLTGSEAKPIVVVMTRTVSASGLDWGVLAAAGVLTVLPGVVVVWFVRKHLVRGFALGRV
ncbi:MAG: carbohydrate ABC transporter permease [Pseudomonadales bacterium]|nr:carbohydrate ABC transporter permease [Pseudomonadales bacterium]MCP5184012.1 carbohydrate ABC transporter permease [Pseudomonadales bacterium]